MHEQTRPDRDDYIDVLFDNIEDGNENFNFKKLAIEEWSNYGQIYDFKSVMHYEGWSFLTKEAREAGKSSIVYKGTNKRVEVNAPELGCSFFFLF